MKKYILYISTVSFVLLLSSCGRYASENDFDLISLRMEKQEVLQKMSAKGIARGSITNKFGQVIEVREYEVQICRPFLPTVIDFYWLYFCEGKLVQWGKAGDWAQTQKMVYDINFNVSKKDYD